MFTLFISFIELRRVNMRCLQGFKGAFVGR